MLVTYFQAYVAQWLHGVPQTEPKNVFHWNKPNQWTNVFIHKLQVLGLMVLIDKLEVIKKIRCDNELSLFINIKVANFFTLQQKLLYHDDTEPD